MTKTYAEWMDKAETARAKVFAELGIEPGSVAARKFDDFFNASNEAIRIHNYSHETGASFQDKKQADISVRQFNNRFFNELQLMEHPSRSAEDRAAAATIRQAVSRYSYETRGPSIPESLFKDPYVSQQGEFKSQGFIGAALGGLLGAGLFLKSGLNWIAKTGLIAAMAVAGGAVSNIVGGWLKGKEEDPPEIAPGMRQGGDPFQGAGDARRPVSDLDHDVKDKAKNAGRGARNRGVSGGDSESRNFVGPLQPGHQSGRRNRNNRSNDDGPSGGLMGLYGGNNGR